VRIKKRAQRSKRGKLEVHEWCATAAKGSSALTAFGIAMFFSKGTLRAFAG
jgi:hypothetical protein